MFIIPPDTSGQTQMHDQMNGKLHTLYQGSVRDPIPAKLIQGSIEILLPVYEVFVNKSLTEGNMDTVKCCVIDPLLKNQVLISTNIIVQLTI